MYILESLGITYEGTKPLAHAGQARYAEDPDLFFHRAFELLDKLGPLVRREVIPRLDEYRGRWHPTGFMVHPLGTHRQVGSIRLHLWPVGHRWREAKGNGFLEDENIFDGDIHNHAWHVASSVLAGYADSIYTLSDPALPGGPKNFRLFRVGYAVDAPDKLADTGLSVGAAVSERRSIERAGSHTILAGEYHAPTIANDTFAATLVVTGFRSLDVGPDVLVRGSLQNSRSFRKDVTTAEAGLAANQLLERL